MKTRLRMPIELIFWIVALVILANGDVREQQTAAHFTLCPLANLGFACCPGCGIGRSITALFHGNLGLSFHLHWFGLPAVIILLYRISILIRLQFSTSRKNNLERKEKSYV